MVCDAALQTNMAGAKSNAFGGHYYFTQVVTLVTLVTVESKLSK